MPTASRKAAARGLPVRLQRLNEMVWPAAVTGLTAAALYVPAANPAVGGGNTGEFQVMSVALGIAHPPSYQLYLLLAALAVRLPGPGDAAWRVNVLTALLGALAIALIAALPPALEALRAAAGNACESGGPRLPAALGGAIAGAAAIAMPRLWTLSVEAEVFTLHLALVAAFWLVLARWQHARGAAASRLLVLAAFVAGLGLANHRTFLFIAAGGALAVLLIQPSIVARPRLLAACCLATAAGLLPYLYVVRGLFVPVAYLVPSDVHRLSPGEVWYVLQGNASAETGNGAIVRRLLADHQLLQARARWLWQHLVAQLGPAGAPLALAGALGLLLLACRAPGWTVGAVGGAAGAALFAMAYQIPDADRYLLPAEVLLALGLGTLAAGAGAGMVRLLRAPRAARAAGLVAAAGLLLGGYWASCVTTLARTTHFTRDGYRYYTLANLEGLAPNAILCSWWASSWGWWYAQLADRYRTDVTIVPKGPDDCLRDVLPREFGRRPVYLPALTEAMKQSDYVFFPSGDLWTAVARRVPLTSGLLIKGPDEKIYLYEQGRRRWIPSLEVFTQRGFQWSDVRLFPDYVLRDLPEGPPVEPP